MATRQQEMFEVVIPSDQVQIDKTQDGLLGRGGYGFVYAGIYRGNKVAVKMLSNEGDIPRQQRHTLKKEARRLMAVCEHPYILDLIGVVMETNNYSLVLEYMHFGTSISFIKNFIVGAPLRIQFAQQIISAMAWLHSREPPVKHLDLKAENVLINNCFTAKISDFGLSEWKTITMAYSTQPIQNGTRCGTISHIPPEVFANIHKKGEVEEDVYAFAVTIWEIFSGANPFANCGSKYELIANAVLSNQRPDLGNLDKCCPEKIKDMIVLSWDQNPQHRPTFKDLERYIEPIYNAVNAEIHSHIKYIRAQIVTSFQTDPQDYSEYYECTKHFDSAEIVQDGLMNGLASPDGSGNERDIAVPPTLQSIGSGGSGQNRENVFEQKVPELSVSSLELETLTHGQIDTQSGQPGLEPFQATVQPSVLDRKQAPKMPETSKNLGLVHVPINETGLKQTNSTISGNEREPGSFHLSGFVSVRDQQYTPGAKLQHPHGPIAQPVSTILERETGQSGEEGEDEETSLKGDAVNDFLNDLSISSPAMLQTLLTSPEALENVLSLVQSGARSVSANQGPAELANFDAGTRTRRANNCAGEVNQELQTMNGSVSVDQLSGQASNGRKPSTMPGTSVQHMTAFGTEANANRTPASQRGQLLSDATSQSHESAVSAQPPTVTSTPNEPVSNQESLRQTVMEDIRLFQQPAQKQTIFGQPVRGHHMSKVQLPPQNQIVGRNNQLDILGSQQAEIRTGSQQAVMNNSTIFGQQSRIHNGSQGNDYVQPFPGIPASSVSQQGVVTQQTVLPQQHVPPAQQMSKPALSDPQTSKYTQRELLIGSQGTAVRHALSPGHTVQDQQRLNQHTANHIQDERRQPEPVGTQKQPITLYHRHAGGGSTTITMDPDSELPPNLQIGNNNYMVVNGSADKNKTEKKKKTKCRKSQLTSNTDELSMDHIDMVSVEIGKDWKRLCRELDMTEADIEQLQFDFHVSGLYEIMYQGIQRWVQRNGRTANVKRMAEALWEIDRDDIALRLH